MGFGRSWVKFCCLLGSGSLSLGMLPASDPTVSKHYLCTCFVYWEHGRVQRFERVPALDFAGEASPTPRTMPLSDSAAVMVFIGKPLCPTFTTPLNPVSPSLLEQMAETNSHLTPNSFRSSMQNPPAQPNPKPFRYKLSMSCKFPWMEPPN